LFSSDKEKHNDQCDGDRKGTKKGINSYTALRGKITDSQ
jgi:hypothetical protein